MHRNLCCSVVLCVLVSGLTFAQAPTVPQGGVVSAASLLPLGAPGYQLSPGGIVSIFGTNLAASTAAAAAIPLPTNLGGATVTIGGVTAPLYYASAGQINAQVPYSVAAGAAVPVVVTTSAGSSAASTIPVVAAAPALFTYSQNGLGNAAAQNYVSSTSTPANGFNVAIAQGGIVIVYGTGGGAVTGGPASGAACNSGSFSSAHSATIGGQSATVQYAGCSPGFVGLDQWNIVVPSTTPAGCYLPLQVTVNGVASNAVTIAVAGNGNCTSAASGQPQVGPGQTLGALQLERLSASTSTAGAFSVQSQFNGLFQKNGAVAGGLTGGFPPVGGGCLVQVYKNNSSSLPVGTTSNTGVTNLDAGAVTLTTPTSSVPVGLTSTGSYGASAFAAITAGSYSVSGKGGANVGAFGPVTLNLPALLKVSNIFGLNGASFSASGTILNPNLTCPDPAGEMIVDVGSQNSSNVFGSAFCAFSCGGNIQVTSSVLQQLPVSASGMAELVLIYIAPNNNAGVTSAQFMASGLNLGFLYYTDVYLQSGLTMTP